jgi:hypothetical protein
MTVSSQPVPPHPSPTPLSPPSPSLAAVDTVIVVAQIIANNIFHHASLQTTAVAGASLLAWL